MSVKAKGINAERELIHMFWKTNQWAACRIAGSGSSRYPSADVLASNAIRRIAIESKVTKEQSKYFSQEEIENFKEFARIFGAEPWLAFKFKGQGWMFLSVEDLRKTNNGLMASVEIANLKGLSFAEMIGNISESKGF